MASSSVGHASPGTEKVDRATKAYNQLRRLIVHGQLAPGSRVVETEVARKLDVSRTPVRSALQRLQQEGFIVASGEGELSRPTVAPLTREDGQEVFEIVGALEGLAAVRAGRMPSPERGPVADRLTEANDVLQALSADPQPDRSRFLHLDNEFHAVYVHAAGGRRLQVLHDAAKAQAERYLRLYVSILTGEIAVSVEEHREIIEAIRMGASKRARDAVCRNWHNAAERLSRVIDTTGERGSW